MPFCWFCHARAHLYLQLDIEPILGVYGVGRGGGRKGAYVASQTTKLKMKRLNKTEYSIFVLLCINCFQSNLLDFCFILQVIKSYEKRRD